ncbi:hypothetical protein WG904_17105 [Pedobacter sp. Du54]|uniref:hypothetical protein n=1 Tax=Pedobacter anseongensis TaxID=3133439 RepID=UPI0030A5025E
MRKLLFLCALAVLASCSTKKTESEKSTIFIEQNVSEFIENNPDWAKNETIEGETTEKFKHKLINLSNDTSFLKGMPLQLKEIKDTSINEIRTKIARFEAYNDTSRNAGSLLNYIQIRILGIVNDNQVNDLAIDKKYTLTGTLHTQGKRKDVKFIHVADFKGYHLGQYTFVITGFKAL